MNIMHDSLPFRVSRILDRAEEGRELSVLDGETLFAAEGETLDRLLRLADSVRQKTVGEVASFVINRNINFTNVCYMGCNFCNFAKRKDEAGAELLPLEEIARRAVEAAGRGATEVCIQGGLHPDIPASHYRDIILAIKRAAPQLHIHAFSPFEIWYASRKARMDVHDFLTELKEAGLGSMPGTAAEILDRDVRLRLTKNKLSTDAWISIIRAAHQVGIPTTSTIMYGHIDGPSHWAAHMALLRDIQKDTGGFSEFVPLGFIHSDSPLYLNNSDVRPGPTRAEHIRLHAVARLMLRGWIDNIQASWVKLGPVLARDMLRYGANDFGGTLINESISRAAGATSGQEVTASEIVRVIRSAGLVPVQRDTLYRPLKRFDGMDATGGQETLVPRTMQQQANIHSATREQNR